MVNWRMEQTMNIKTYKLKRLLDLSMITGGLIFPLLWPLWIVVIFIIPLLIWLEDRGPIFYSQVYKFRTMIPDAEKISGAVWSTKNDPRITNIGHILRKTALDEIPQLLNIIRGEMSFVGPRAERPELHNEFIKTIPEFDERLKVTPGLSGLAQISGSYDLDPSEKIKFDLEYIEKMGLFFDLKIISLSVFNSIFARWDSPEN